MASLNKVILINLGRPGKHATPPRATQSTAISACNHRNLEGPHQRERRKHRMASWVFFGKLAEIAGSIQARAAG